MTRASKRFRRAFQKVVEKHSVLILALRNHNATTKHAHEVHNAVLSVLAAQRALVEARTPPCDEDVLNAGEGVL